MSRRYIPDILDGEPVPVSWSAPTGSQVYHVEMPFPRGPGSRGVPAICGVVMPSGGVFGVFFGDPEPALRCGECDRLVDEHGVLRIQAIGPDALTG